MCVCCPCCCRHAAKQVSIGSYPNTAAADVRYKVKLQFSSRDADAVSAAVLAARGALIHVFDLEPA